MRRERDLRFLWEAGLAGLLVLASLPVHGQEAARPGQELATVAVLGGSVAWLPNGNVSSHGMTLTVSGSATVFNRTFAAGEPPTFQLTDRDHGTLPDGSYTWELREEHPPVNDGVYDPANGRDSAAAEPRAPVVLEGRVQSGVFTIVNGSLVDPSQVEKEAKEADQQETSKGGGEHE